MSRSDKKFPPYTFATSSLRYDVPHPRTPTSSLALLLHALLTPCGSRTPVVAISRPLFERRLHTLKEDSPLRARRIESRDRVLPTHAFLSLRLVPLLCHYPALSPSESVLGTDQFFCPNAFRLPSASLLPGTLCASPPLPVV